MKCKNRVLANTKLAIDQIKPLSKAPKALFALAKNHRRIVSALEAVEESRKTIYKQHFEDAAEVNGKHPNWSAFSKDYDQILDTEVDFEPHKFSEGELNLELNEIAPAVLSEILWLLNEDPAAKNGA